VRYGNGKIEELGGRPVKGLLGYNVYRNGEKVNDVAITTTSYTDTLPGYGDYDFNVSAVYDEGESPWSGTASFSYHIGIEEPLEPIIKVYPNPAADHLVVHSEKPMKVLRLIALPGNTVIEAEPGTKQFTLLPGNLPAGIYLLEVITNDGRALMKVVLK